MRRDVPILDGAAGLLERYDLVFCDVWGVVHNGIRAYEPAGEALAKFRARGGVVVLLSNAPTPSPVVARLLDAKGVRRDAWDRLVTSGDITRAYVGDRGFTRIHHIGEPRDLPIFDGLAVTLTDLASAEAIVCTGLGDDTRETAEMYRPVLETARDLALPLVCANPDLVVEVGGVLYPCAGSIAVIYEAMGGDVFWAGKPHPTAYETAYAAALSFGGRQVDRRRILGIGDALRTDIAGASAYGIDSLLVAGGIHAEAILRHGRLDPTALGALIATSPDGPTAAIDSLRW